MSGPTDRQEGEPEEYGAVLVFLGNHDAGVAMRRGKLWEALWYDGGRAFPEGGRTKPGPWCVKWRWDSIIWNADGVGAPVPAAPAPIPEHQAAAPSPTDDQLREWRKNRAHALFSYYGDVVIDMQDADDPDAVLSHAALVATGHDAIVNALPPWATDADREARDNPRPGPSLRERLAPLLEPTAATLEAFLVEVDGKAWQRFNCTLNTTANEAAGYAYEDCADQLRHILGKPPVDHGPKPAAPTPIPEQHKSDGPEVWLAGEPQGKGRIYRVRLPGLVYGSARFEGHWIFQQDNKPSGAFWSEWQPDAEWLAKAGEAHWQTTQPPRVECRWRDHKGREGTATPEADGWWGLLSDGDRCRISYTELPDGWQWSPKPAEGNPHGIPDDWHRMSNGSYIREDEAELWQVKTGANGNPGRTTGWWYCVHNGTETPAFEDPLDAIAEIGEPPAFDPSHEGEAPNPWRGGEDPPAPECAGRISFVKGPHSGHAKHDGDAWVVVWDDGHPNSRWRVWSAGAVWRPSSLDYSPVPDPPMPTDLRLHLDAVLQRRERISPPASSLIEARIEARLLALLPEDGAQLDATDAGLVRLYFDGLQAVRR